MLVSLHKYLTNQSPFTIKYFSLMIRKIVPIIVLLSLFFFSAGCASSEKISLEEKIRQVYIEHDRLDRFYELQEQYDNIRLILWINQESDSYWITNFTLWLVFSVLPDLPEVLATGGLIALIYGLAWWLGITLAGGGILALLAWVGSLFGGIPGIPPAIAGIVYLGVMLLVFFRIFSLVF